MGPSKLDHTKVNKPHLYSRNIKKGELFEVGAYWNNKWYKFKAKEDARIVNEDDLEMYPVEKNDWVVLIGIEDSDYYVWYDIKSKSWQFMDGFLSCASSLPKNWGK